LNEALHIYPSHFTPASEVNRSQGRHKKGIKNQKIRTFKFFGHMYRSKVNLTRKEKESLVIKLAWAGKATRDMAQVAHVPLKDIGAMLRRYAGGEGESIP